MCEDLRNYETIKTASIGEKLAWNNISTAYLDIGTFRASLKFLEILHSNRLILFHSNNSHGIQTVENHLLHTGSR